MASRLPRSDSGEMAIDWSYRIESARTASEWRDVEQPTTIVGMPCRFGGARPYFVCPGVINGIVCGR